MKKKENILVTGGAGFIGSHLVDRLLAESKYKIFVLDDFSTGKLENLPQNLPDLEIISGKVEAKTLIEKLFKRIKFDYIFHEAAISSIQKSISNPFYAHQVNAVSTILLLEQVKKQFCLKRFIYASSTAVYADSALLKKEIDNINPVSTYGIDKLTSEKYISFYHAYYSIPTTILRYFNVYGPRQNADSDYSAVIPIFLHEFKKANPQITIFGDGHQTRDFVHVDDIVKANLMVMNRQECIGQIYNLGTSKATSIIDLVQIFEQITGKKGTITFKPLKSGDIKRSVADISKIRNIGFEPEFDLKRGLEAVQRLETRGTRGTE